MLLLLGLQPLDAAAQQPQRWSLVPDLRIGDEERPNYALSRVSDVAVGPAGEIFVAQPQERRVRQYDGRGVYVRSFGGQGSGPGEFQALDRMGWKGDSLWVADVRQQRVTFFSRTGRVLGTIRATSPVIPGTGYPTPASAVLADGSLLGRPGPSTDAVQNGTATVLPLLRMNRSGAVTGRFGEVDVRGETQVVRHGGRIMHWTVPLQSHSLWDASPDGSAVVVVHRPVPASSAPAEFRVAKYAASGAGSFDRGYRYTPRPVTAADRDSIHAVLTGIFQEIRFAATRGQAQEIVREEFPVPEFHPPITEVTAGRDGTIWLRRERPRTGKGEYTVLDGVGAVIATVAAPPGLRILQAQRDVVWGVELDELEVPHVVRYRVAVGR